VPPPELPPRTERPRLERDVQNEIRARLARDYRTAIVWRNNVGQLRDANGRVVRYGLCEGSADLIACVPTALACPSCGSALPPIGRFVGLEVKGPLGRTTDEQRGWSHVVNAAHGVSGFAWSADDAATLITRAREQW